MDARARRYGCLDQADAIRRRQAHPFVELFDPRSGGVNQSARLPDIFLPVSISSARQLRHFPAERRYASIGKDAALRHLCVSQRYQTRIVYPAVGIIFESAHDCGLSTESAPNRTPVEPGKRVRLPR